jgi:ferrous iron transport protein B
MTKKISIALAGNPNVGKSVLFNALTGGKQHVGNWPGKTVEKKEGTFTYKNHKITVVDLPGTYSLNAYSTEEIIARDYIVDGNPDIVIHIVDSTNLERNLYLTIQLIELGAKIILVLNMMDCVEKDGLKIDEKKISRFLKIPVIKMVATKKKGIDQLLETIVREA